MKFLRRSAEWLAGFPRWVIVPLSLTVMLTAVLLFAWVYLTRSVGTVRVPSVTDESLSSARAILDRHGLGFEVVRTTSMKTPEGEVIRQVPPGGTRMKENRTVELYVSQGAEYVTVPDLQGQTPRSAKNLLYRRSGGREQRVGPLLTVGSIARVHSEKQPEREIFLQQPSAGQRVLRGSRVDLLVSKGPWPRRTVVPELRGMTLDAAKRILSRSELSLNQVQYRRNQDEPSSVVLAQSPPSGRIVLRDRSVNLTVNLQRARSGQKLRHTMVRITPPLSLTSGRMRVIRQDLRGKREVFGDTVPPGKPVEFLTSVKGDGELTIYWNDRILGFRELEARE